MGSMAAAGIDRHDPYALSSMGASSRMTQGADRTGSVSSSIPSRTILAVITELVSSERVSGRSAPSMRPTP
jgi:hypothetical protein